MNSKKHLYQVFIDGEAGTTGLQVRERLGKIDAISLLQIDPSLRKDTHARQEQMQLADLVILCLPDDQARASIALIDTLAPHQRPRIIDASSAHRVTPGWVYGFAEMDQGQIHAQTIAQAERVSNPGCYATGAIALLRPLVQASLLHPEDPITLFGISGYSGGGRAMIQAYTQSQAAAFELYSLGSRHKHLPEIMAYSLLQSTPVFVPAVGNFAQGMLVQLPLHLQALHYKPSIEAITEALHAHYAGSRLITVAASDTNGRLAATTLQNSDNLQLFIYPSAATLQQVVLVARLDNLGKGASGAAVQNTRLMLNLNACN